GNQPPGGIALAGGGSFQERALVPLLPAAKLGVSRRRSNCPARQPGPSRSGEALVSGRDEGMAPADRRAGAGDLALERTASIPVIFLPPLHVPALHMLPFPPPRYKA